MLDQINRLAASTPWLHPVIAGYATYGVVAFVALLALGWWTARRSGRQDKVATAVLAGAATLLAVALGFARAYIGAHSPRDVVAGLSSVPGSPPRSAYWRVHSRPGLSASRATRGCAH